MEDDLFDILENNEVLENKIEVDDMRKTEIVDQFIVDNTKHEAILPSESVGDYVPLDREIVPTSKTYPFKLDSFQTLAIAAIEADRSLLVSAHTSCGKTVVAEYAIAKSIENKQRVIYTSPIKALSNQKFRELQEEFGDVGLMTGDVTLNPEATCLVMTTEILRNMLYKGTEISREIHWIIFDEIHYMKDRERGVVWEETIILLKKHVRMVFLSATIPNAREFAEWITQIHGDIMHVIYTEKRIIPLEHNMYSDKLYLIKDEKESLHLENFTRCQEGTLKKGEVLDAMDSVLGIAALPAVVFSFGRVTCERFANRITKDLLSKDEKELATNIFENAIQTLSNSDQNLPAVLKMKDLFVRGIGVHHSGLLPIVKEIGEILFQEGLIKILFATESFSIGLNMPAKSVIFSELMKFDGKEKRVLTSGEYCQMAGRAGRRGLDKRGIVISLASNKLDTKELEKLMSSKTDELTSAFRLTYNMILNLMRVEEFDATYFMSHSFYHYQAYSRAIKMEEELKKQEEMVDDPESENIYFKISNLSNIMIGRGHKLTDYYNNKLLKGQVVSLLVQIDGSPVKIDRAIIKEYDKESETVIVVSAIRNTEPDGDKYVWRDEKYPTHYITIVYEERMKRSMKLYDTNITLHPKPMNYSDDIIKISNGICEDNKLIFNMISSGRCLICSRSHIDGCIMDEEECYAISDGAFYGEIERMGSREEVAGALKYRKYLKQRYIQRTKQEKIDKLTELKQIYHMEDCRKMTGVLRDLQFLDGNTVLLKGKMASEISSADEILLTEMIFDSAFNKLDIKDMVALISILVTERSKEGEEIVMSEQNYQLKLLFDTAINKIVNVMQKNGIEITTEMYVANYSYYMMDIVKMWMSGATFAEISDQVSVFEGSIIRGFKRLEELLRQLSNAAQVIGNNELVNLFGQAIYCIKRDIVFANSLYL